MTFLIKLPTTSQCDLWQVSIYLKLPAIEQHYVMILGKNIKEGNLFVADSNYMYGSGYVLFALSWLELEHIMTNSPLNTGTKRFFLGRSRFSNLKTTKNECDEQNSANSVFDCQMEFLEESSGCSLFGGNQNIQRYSLVKLSSSP